MLNGQERYRDYGLLRYWFRMVETNASWVNHIFLVTDNQIPDWLNKDHPKLSIVRHKEFMPLDALPTFNSNAIQMYIHNIKGLSEHFVLFDDDMFINRPIKKSVFFDKRGLPRDVLAFNIINPIDQFAHLFVNNLVLINKNHLKSELMKRHFFKVFNLHYGLLNFVNLYFLIFPNFTRFYDLHLPYPYVKSQYKRVMSKYKNEQNITGHQRFREITDITHWLVRYEMLVNGLFSPTNHNNGKLIYLGDIIPKRKKIITIGDKNISRNEFNKEIDKIRLYFTNKYLPSKFEK